MKVYIICGKARHGKDTTAAYMQAFYEEIGQKACIMHLSNYIKHFARDYFGWDGQEETKPRTLLQQLGTDIIRQKMNKPLFFINRLLEDIEVLNHFYDVVMIADVRLPLEITEIKKRYPQSVVVHITRLNYESPLSQEEQHHITETALDDYDQYDYQLENTTLEKLQQDAQAIVRKEEHL